MRVAIYARVSTQRQAQAQTIEQQLERLQTYVQQEGWSLSEENIFRDDGYSGSGLNRPGLDRLRDRVAAGEIDKILLTAPDRLARNYVHQMVLLEEFEKYGCQVTFLDRPMSQDPHDQLVLQIRGAVAEYERTLIADRMRRGRQSKYRAGILLPWTQTPYGYQVQPDHPRNPAGVQIHEEQAAIIREIFAFYLQKDTSLYGVVQHLHEMQIPSPKGELYWNTATVRGILTNPAYSGNVYANRTHSVKPRRRRSATHLVGKPAESHTTLPEETWMPVASIPAIICPEQLEEVKVKLSRNKQFSRRNNTAHAYLLRALVSCGVCNLSCTARQLNPGYTYYVCRGKDTRIKSHLTQRCPARFIPADQLDELVWQDICEVMLHPEIMTIALQQAQNGNWLPQELQARRENLRKAKNALQNQLDRLTDAYLNGIIPLSEYQYRRSELEHRQQGLEEQEQQLTRQVDRQKELTGLQDSVVHFSQRIQIGLEHATFEQKRKLIELLIDRVVVKDGDVEIRYVIPTSPESEHIRFCQLHKDYFNPHAALISFECFPKRRQIGGQQPGFFFAHFPVSQDIHRIGVQLGQLSLTQPQALTCLGQQASQRDPGRLIVFSHQMTALLTQNVLPMPLIQLSQHFYRSKFRVSQHQNMSIGWQKLVNIVQQSQLSTTGAVSATAAHPHPDQWNGSSAISQSNDQKLVTKTDFAAIDQQTIFLSSSLCQKFFYNRLIPIPHSKGRTFQKAIQSSGGTNQHGCARKLAGHFAQVNRLALKNPGNQPGQVSYPGNSLVRKQLRNFMHPGIIEGGDRHWVSPFCKMVPQNRFYRSSQADHLFLAKLSGS